MDIMNVNKALESLDKVIVFQLDVSLWEGRSHLSDQDLPEVDSDKLPPKKDTSLGSKLIFPRDRLNLPKSKKKAAERYLDQVGLKFGRGPVFAISKSLLNEVASKLDELGAEFDAYVKGPFTQHYDTWFDEFVASQDKDWWQVRLRKAKKTRDEAVKGFSWSYQVIPLGFIDEHSQGVPSGINKGLEKKVTGLSGQLFDEIASRAISAVDKGVFSKDRVRRDSLNHFHQIRKKMDALSFLDSRIHPIISRIDNTLNAVKSATAIEGNDLTALVGLLHLLADAARMKNYGQAVINNRSVPDKSVEPVSVDETVEEGLPLAEVHTLDPVRSDESVTGDQPGTPVHTEDRRKVANAGADEDNGWF